MYKTKPHRHFVSWLKQRHYYQAQHSAQHVIILTLLCFHPRQSTSKEHFYEDLLSVVRIIFLLVS